MIYLPDELLAASFDRLVAISVAPLIYPISWINPPYPRCLLTLMLVCRRWREIVLGQPSLWGHIDTSWGQVAPVLLDRSKNAPLTVVARDGDDPIAFPEVLFSADADGFLTNLLTAHAQHIRRYIWIQRITQARRPSWPHIPVLPLLQYSTPRLRTLDITTDWWDPDLDQFLDFLSRTPGLKHLSLCIDVGAYNWSEAMTRTPRRAPITMEHLETFHCCSENPASKALLLSHLTVPRLREVTYKIYAQSSPTEISAELCSRLLPFSLHTVRPRHLDFDEDRPFLSIKSRDLVEPPSIREFDVTFSCITQTFDFEDAIVQCGDVVTVLHENLFDLSSVVSLRCHMSLPTTVWNNLLSTLYQLTTLQIAFASFKLFLPVFLQKAYAKAASLPSLSFINIYVGSLTSHLIVGETWLSIPESAQLNEALLNRSKAGLPRLQLFRITMALAILPLVECMPEDIFYPYDWRNIAPHFRRLRELVETVTIVPDIRWLKWMGRELLRTQGRLQD